MTPEERSLLERTASLTEENNTMLRSIRRAGRFSLGMRIGYWSVIILLSFGAYYFIQPYIQTMTSLFSGNSAADTSSQNQGESPMEMLNSLLH